MSNKLISIDDKVSVFSKTVLFTPENANFTGTTAFDFLEEIDNAKQILIDTLYPVGSIYFVDESVYEAQGNSILPENQFPGTVWQEIHRTLIGKSADYPLGSEGGEVWHQLTISEMPSHTHRYSKAKPNSGYRYSGTGARENGEGTASGNYSTTLRGGDQAHLNLQPYEKVLIFKRVA